MLGRVNDIAIHDAHAAELDAVTLYRILKLRVDVFVVEQNSPYPELDGRDLEQGARLVWAQRAQDAGDVVGTLRLVDDGDAVRIGRVATAASARAAGLAGRLMSRALELTAKRDTVLDAQSYLRQWYEKFGYTVDGAEFVEDGIAHVPMRRPGQ